jgi:MOSC domain-containing protein YiiM
MHMKGKVLALFLALPQRSARQRMDTMQLEAEGIVGDKYFGKNLQRSILITSVSSYTMAREAGIDITFGALGENIVVDVGLYHLNPGARLRIGDVTLEITQNCTLCSSLAQVHGQLPKLLRNDRGIFARVVTPGRIKKDDDTELL